MENAGCWESLICQATIHIISAESGVCEMVFVDTHDKESIMKKVNSNYGFITGRSICIRVIVEYGFVIKADCQNNIPSIKDQRYKSPQHFHSQQIVL